MEIKGPLTISVQDDDTSLKRELHISFKPAFVESDVLERITQLEAYMSELVQALQQLSEDAPDRPGVETHRSSCPILGGPRPAGVR